MISASRLIAAGTRKPCENPVASGRAPPSTQRRLGTDRQDWRARRVRGRRCHNCPPSVNPQPKFPAWEAGHYQARRQAGRTPPDHGDSRDRTWVPTVLMVLTPGARGLEQEQRARWSGARARASSNSGTASGVRELARVNSSPFSVPKASPKGHRVPARETAGGPVPPGARGPPRGCRRTRAAWTAGERGAERFAEARLQGRNRQGATRCPEANTPAATVIVLVMATTAAQMAD